MLAGMKRPFAIALGLAVLGAALLLLRGRGGGGSGPEVVETVAPAASIAELRRRAPAQAAPDLSVLVDDDVAGTLRLEGQVIDEADEPVGGAEVTLNSNPPRTAVTEEDGSFAFDRLVGRRYALVAQAEDGVAGPVTARLNETSDPVVLRLRTGASIEVSVVTARDKNPVAGAAVEVRGLITRAATAGADGVARMSGLPTGRFQLVARADGYAPSSQFLGLAAATTSERRTIELRPGAAVSGRVTDPGGRPVAGAAVLYQGASDWALRADPRRDAVLTAADGTFEIPALPAGTVRLTARHEDFAPGTTEPLTLDGRSARSDVVIVLEAGATVSGRVVDTDGQPVGWASVRVAVEGRLRARARQTSADENGAFEMRALPRRPVQVVALHDTAASETESVDLTEVEARTDLKLVLEIDGRISGIVVDGAGEPVEGAQVMARPDVRRGAGDRFEWRLRGVPQELTDAGGRFEFSGLRDIAYRLVAVPAGVNPWSRGWRERGQHTIGATVGEANLRLVLEQDGGVKGKVVFEDGATPDTFLVASGRFGSGTPFSSRDGAFELGSLAPNTYTITVRGPDFEDRSVPDVEVRAGEFTDLGTVSVRKGRVVAGRVVDPSGQAIEGATVLVGRRIFGSGSETSSQLRFGAGQTKSATTDENGAFSVRGVGPGNLSVVAEHEELGRSVPVAAVGQPPGGPRLEIVVLPFGAIEGTVTRGGSPADSVFVQAQSKTVVTTSFGVQTGPDGKFRFDRLAPDEYLVQASESGNPFRGRGFESASATLVSGQTAVVNLELAGGDYTLLVRPVAERAAEVLGQVTAVEGLRVTATTAAQLEEQVGRRESGFTTFSFASSRGPATLTNLRAGTWTVCAVPLPAEVAEEDARQYWLRAGDSLPVFCASKALEGGAQEQLMDLPVELPAYLAPP